MSTLDFFTIKGYVALVLAAATISFAWTSKIRKSSHSKLPLPPGPPRLPILGNLLQMPSSHLWEKAADWGRKYGDLIYLENLGVPTLIINSYEACEELLNKRSLIYSSRPHSIMSHELANWGKLTSMLPYGDSVRKQRGYLHRFFQSHRTLNYLELQQKETIVMLKGILDDPEHYEKHIRRLPGAVISRNVYGHEVRDENDEFIQLGEAGVRSAGDSLIYSFLDSAPMLRYIPEWFPGATFHAFAAKARRISVALISGPPAATKKQISEGTAKESMVSILFSENTEDEIAENEGDIVHAAATVFLGGADSSVTSIMLFILAILEDPEIQVQGQREIDRVIGLNRLPVLADWDSLPYVRAICTEILRWKILAPMALAHFLTEEDEYRGYRIPANTVILPNTWAISQDPNLYPNPHVFKPERWIQDDGDQNPALQPHEYAFGFGRRICPGQNWAEHIIFIAIASILATFNIEKATDANGVPIPLNDELSTSPIRSLVEPSRCIIKPRSERVVELVQQAFTAL